MLKIANNSIILSDTRSSKIKIENKNDLTLKEIWSNIQDFKKYQNISQNQLAKKIMEQMTSDLEDISGEEDINDQIEEISVIFKDVLLSDHSVKDLFEMGIIEKIDIEELSILSDVELNNLISWLIKNTVKKKNYLNYYLILNCL